MPQLHLAFIRTLCIKPIFIGVQKHYGVRPEQLGLPPSLLSNKMNLLPINEVSVWLEKIEEITGDPGYMLTIAPYLHLKHFDVMGEWFLSAPDLSITFRRINYGINSLQSGASFHGSQSGNIIKWCYHSEYFQERARFHDSVRIAVCMVHTLREYVGKNYAPLRVQLSGPPCNSEQFTDFFGCDVEWNAAETQVWLNIAVLAHESRMETAENKKMLMPFHQLDEFLNMPQPHDHAKIFYEVINYCRHFGLPTVDKAASCFQLSRQQLQRQLHSYGWSFSTITGYVQCNLAIQLMMKGEPIEEIAKKLGYSNKESFSKTFKKNRGKTPKQYLEKLKQKKMT